MTIKIEDIRVGDSVTLHAKIAKAANVDGGFVASISGPRIAIDMEDIATHTPAPREFKRGDKVTWGRGCVGEIIAIDDDIAWVKSGAVKINIHVSNLRHADDPTLAPQEPAEERKKIEAWVNVYQGGLMHVFSSNRSAVLSAGPGRRIACLHVVGYEGDGL